MRLVHTLDPTEEQVATLLGQLLEVYGLSHLAPRSPQDAQVIKVKDLISCWLQDFEVKVEHGT